MSTPWLTFGQETLSSSAATPGTASSRAARATNSSIVAPAMLTITGAPQSSSQGSWVTRKASTPSLSRPMELSSPAAVSTVRQGTLPRRGCGVIVLGTTPPSRRRSTSPAISRPYPNVPEATMTGFGSRSRPKAIDRSGGDPALGVISSEAEVKSRPVIGRGGGTGRV